MGHPHVSMSSEMPCSLFHLLQQKCFVLCKMLCGGWVHGNQFDLALALNLNTSNQHIKGRTI
jgi:hypothetical protein